MPIFVQQYIAAQKWSDVAVFLFEKKLPKYYFIAVPQELEICLPPHLAAHPTELRAAVAAHLHLDAALVQTVEVLRRSIDARGKQVYYWLRLRVWLSSDEAYQATAQPPIVYRSVNSRSKVVIIVGAGPAGLFAALQLLQLGIKPFIVERGKNVRDRRRDLAAINKQHLVDPNSNYCFGEGGAGTYSDGKLYTRSGKRGSIAHVLQTLVQHGADPAIQIDAHPHIGTNKLPHIIEAIRQTILDAGGEIHFGKCVDRLLVHQQHITGVQTTDGDTLNARAVILATGHSSRGVFEMLQQQHILIEPKPFAMGVRIEHPQALINQQQYRQHATNPYLPPAAYSWVEQAAGRGVYSFCMCPGGIIAPCATAMGEVVTNGWSPSRRNNPYANSGVVVAIQAADWQPYLAQHGALAGLRLQQSIEQAAWQAGGGTQAAPAQRLVDFLEQRLSATLPHCSYIPGIQTAMLSQQVLPPYIYHSLQQGLRQYGRKNKAYLTNEAVVVAVESRTSSPVRIPRHPLSLQHPQVAGLYPVGEGAGYAGGIVSAAIDGMRAAAIIGGGEQ